MHSDIDDILLSEEEILRGIERVAGEIRDEYEGDELVVVSILKGSFIFASDLIRRIPLRLSLSFVFAESYRDGTTSGELELHMLPALDELHGRRVLVLDDILDTGRTLDAVTRSLREAGAADVRSCAFLDKPARRQVAFEADHRCFEIDDRFVVGYGLDFAGYYRNLPYVGALRASVVDGVGGAR